MRWGDVVRVLELNGVKFNFHYGPATAAAKLYGEKNVPGTDLYLALSHANIQDLAKAAGLKSYDYALPQLWFDAYLQEHGEAPRGVWSYDSNLIFGDFVSVDDMIRRIGAQIVSFELA